MAIDYGKLFGPVEVFNLIFYDERNTVIGSGNHGMPVSDKAAQDIVDALKDVVALKMEGLENMFLSLDPRSTEVVIRRTLDYLQPSYLPEFDGTEKRDQKLLSYGMPIELAELAVGPLGFRRSNQLSFREVIDLGSGIYYRAKDIFSFVDGERALENFKKIGDYWTSKGLSPLALDFLLIDIEEYIGEIREYGFWLDNLRRFRARHQGKVAVSCGAYHVPFCLHVLVGRDPVKPAEWGKHFEGKREISNVRKYLSDVIELYGHLNKALGIKVL